MTDTETPKLILIIEDSEEDYEAVLRVFKKAHLDNPFFWCKSGRSALDYLKHEGAFSKSAPVRPGLVLLDLNMPGIDGLKTLQMIRQEESLKDLPVVILTTSSHMHDITSSYQQGANAYLQKPVTFEGLLDAVKGLKEFWFAIPAQQNGGQH